MASFLELFLSFNINEVVDDENNIKPFNRVNTKSIL